MNKHRKCLADVKKLHLLKVKTKDLLFKVFHFLAQHLPLIVFQLRINYLGTKINLNYIVRCVSNRAMHPPVSAIKSNESIFYTEITIIFPENHKNINNLCGKNVEVFDVKTCGM
jgi:hypothetical protein